MYEYYLDLKYWILVIKNIYKYVTVVYGNVP